MTYFHEPVPSPMPSSPSKAVRRCRASHSLSSSRRLAVGGGASVCPSNAAYQSRRAAGAPEPESHTRVQLPKGRCCPPQLQATARRSSNTGIYGMRNRSIASCAVLPLAANQRKSPPNRLANVSFHRAAASYSVRLSSLAGTGTARSRPRSIGSRSCASLARSRIRKATIHAGFRWS